MKQYGKECVVSGLAFGTEYNVHVEIYFEEGKLNSNIITQKTKEIALSDLKPGDYIKYDSGSTGVIMCRVLYPLSSEFGLQIISENSVQQFTVIPACTFSQGVSYYNNAITRLNNACENYLNREYAVEARCVGSNPMDKNSETLPSLNGDAAIETFNTAEEMNHIQDWAQIQQFGLEPPEGTEEKYILASRRVIYSSMSMNISVYNVLHDSPR